MQIEKPLLIIDGNNTLYRAYYSYQKLNNKGKKVSCIFGTPSIVKGLIEKFKPQETYICWDGKKSKERLRILPDYKKRTPKLNFDYKDFLYQKGIVMEMFYLLGIKQIYQWDMEADDNIYFLWRKLRKRNNPIIIISTDKDFNQLINSQTFVYNTYHNLTLDKKSIKEMKGYTPKQTVDYLTLLGDKSDNIQGYKGIGEKKAIEFLTKYSSIRNFLSLPEEHSIINKSTLTELMIKNKYLMDLRFYYKEFIRGKQKISYFKENKKPKLNKEGFFKICDEFYIRLFKKSAFLNAFQK